MKTVLRILLSGIFLPGMFGTAFSQQLSLPTGRAIGPVVKSLTVENGLPQGFITGIVQDKQGFVWMGTKEGLVRYDGYQTRVFKNKPGDSLTLASNNILYLYLDRQNKLWIIYADHAVDIFDPVTHTVGHVSRRPGLSWLSKSTYLQPAELYEDSRRRYWFVSPDMKRLDHFTLQHPAAVPVAVPAGERIMALRQGRKGKIWVCTTKALYIFEDKKGRLQKVAALPAGIHYGGYRLSGMVQDGRGNWIIGDQGCVLIFTTRRRWNIVPTPFPGKPTRFVLKAPNGHVYLNAGNRVFQLHPDRTLSAVWANREHPGNLESLMIDRTNVLWAGTNTFGVRLINLSFRGFRSYTYHYGFIFDVLQAMHFPVQQSASMDNETSYLTRYAKDPEGDLWFIHVTRPGGRKPVPPGYLPLFEWAKNGRDSIIPVRVRSGEWLQIAFDHRGRCWAIVMDKDNLHGLLGRVDPVRHTFIPRLHLPVLYNKIAYLTSCGQHKLCIVYSGAVQLYDPENGSSAIYYSKDSFDNASLLTTVQDPRNDSILWFTTTGSGLIRFNTISGKAKIIDEADGIPGNTVYAAIPDDRGYLWCSSNKGIFRFSPVNGRVLSFTANDGLQGNEFNRYHFLKTPDGHIIFGGTRGWTIFDPDSVSVDTVQPPVVITDILVKNRPLTRLKKWKDSAVEHLRRIELPYDQNFITFTFAALEFNSSDQLRYRYQLQGLDKSWIGAGVRHTANYTGLPPGNYTFKIDAANTSGQWSSHIKTLQVVILPPWWETWWAYLVYALIIVTLICGFYRYRIRRLRIRHQMILQQKEAEQLKQLDEMKTRFFSNITHEFRTPLSLIIAPLEQLHQEPDVSIPVKKKVSVIRQNARHLLRLINQLLDISKMEAGNMKIFLSRGDPGLFVQTVIKTFEDRLIQKNIQFRFENSLHGTYEFDADKWQKIISNLLSNAVKFTPEGGSITVQLAVPVRDADGMDQVPSDEQDILLEVSDSGVGVPADKLPHIFDRFYQADNSTTRAFGGTGIGLALVKELIELMKGRIKVESSPGRGTTFLMTIPARKAKGETDDLRAPDKQVAEYGGRLARGNEMQKPVTDKKSPVILVVEDNEALNHFIAGLLGDHYRVRRAANGRQAWEIAREDLPDVIISDIMMPEMDGYRLCQKIRRSAATNHIAMILLSARSSHDSVMKGLERFADDYLAKPFYPDELLLRIHNLLRRQQNLRDYYYRRLTRPEEEHEEAAIRDPFLVKLYEVIEANLVKGELNVDLLAEQMGMSRRTLNRRLEMAAGLSAGRVIRQYKLKKAAQLLRSGYNASEAAYRSGFESPSYFSASFKEWSGKTPSEFSREHYS